jgi:ANTAR domain-containing protein
MERHGVDERAGFERLRDHARAASRRLVDVAADVLDRHVPRHQRLPVPRLNTVARFESPITPLPEVSNSAGGPAGASLTAKKSAPTRKPWLPLPDASQRSVRQPRDARKGRTPLVSRHRPTVRSDARSREASGSSVFLGHVGQRWSLLSDLRRSHDRMVRARRGGTKSSPGTWCKRITRRSSGRAMAAQAAWSWAVSSLLSACMSWPGPVRTREIDSAER